MVLTRGQQAGDPSPADPERFQASTGNPRAAPSTNGASGTSVSASGDAHGSARKPVHGSLSGQLASQPASTYQLGAQARLSASTTEYQTAPADSYHGSPVSSGPHTPSGDSASPSLHDHSGPSILEPTRCTIYTTHAASGIQTNANTMAPLVPPTLRPLYAGNYSSEAGLSQPYFRRDITNLFGLPEPRLSQRREPNGTLPITTAREYQASVLHPEAPGNPSLLDGVRELLAPRPTTTREPVEVQREPILATGQFPDTTRAHQVVPDIDMRPRDTRPRTAPVNDGATALRDKRLADYEARLNHSQARPTATTEIGDERSDPVAATGGGILRGAGHGYLLQPQCASRPSRLATNVTDSPWARHQQRAQNLSQAPTRPSGAVYRDVHYRDPGLEHEGTIPCQQQFVPRQRYQTSMETPDDASETDAQPEFVPLPRSTGTQPQPPHYGDVDYRGERRSRRDWYEMPQRAPRECEPPVGRYEAPRHFDGAYVPARANPVAHLAKMQDFQGEGNDRLDSFFDHVEELADFYRWDERETCRQARAHLRGTALAYVKRAPFQPRSWEELKALLLKRFQPRDLTATYKAQFRARRCRASTYVCMSSLLHLRLDRNWDL